MTNFEIHFLIKIYLAISAQFVTYMIWKVMQTTKQNYRFRISIEERYLFYHREFVSLVLGSNFLRITGSQIVTRLVHMILISFSFSFKTDVDALAFLSAILVGLCSGIIRTFLFFSSIFVFVIIGPQLNEFKLRDQTLYVHHLWPTSMALSSL